MKKRVRFFQTISIIFAVAVLTGAEIRPGELAMQEAAAYRAEGLELQRLGDLRGAESAFLKALAIHPGYDDVHNDLGVILESLGEEPAAERSYLRALELNPGFAPAHSNLALLYERSGQVRKAAEHWGARVRLGPPDNPWVAKARKKLERYALPVPETEVRRAQRQKKEIRLRLESGRLHMKEKRWQAAAEDFQRVLELDPDHRAARDGLARAEKELEREIARRQRDLDRARRQAEREAAEAIRAAKERAGKEHAGAPVKEGAGEAPAAKERAGKERAGAPVKEGAGEAPAAKEHAGKEHAGEPVNEGAGEATAAKEHAEKERAGVEAAERTPSPVLSGEALALAQELARERQQARRRILSELMDRATAAMRAGDYAEAVNRYSQALTLEPGSGQARRGLDRARRALERQKRLSNR